MKRVVEAAFAHRRKTLPNSLELAGLAARERAAAALAALGRAADDARRGARAAGVRRARRGARVSARCRRRRRSTSRSSSARARPDGKHEVVTVLQRVDLADRVELEPRRRLARRRLRGATRSSARALERARRGRRRRAALARARSRSGSRSRPASAAAAPTPRPRSRSRTRRSPSRSPPSALHELAARLGADVPFFLAPGPQLGEGDGTELAPLDLPQDYWVVLAAAARRDEAVDRATSTRRSTRAAARTGFEERRAALLDALARVRRPRDLAALPPNDLASLAARRRAARARRVPRRRQRRRPGGLRPLPPPRAAASAARARSEPRRAHLGHGSCVVRLSRGAEHGGHRARQHARGAAGSASAGCGSRSGSPSSRASSSSSTSSRRGSRSSPASRSSRYWFFLGRDCRTRPRPRRRAGSAAVSQVIVALVPLLVVLRRRRSRSSWLVLIALLAALVVLLADRALSRAPLRRLPPINSLGRSQVVRQRVLVPRSQVRILAPQPCTPMTQRLAAVVMAAGLGTRMHSATPKHLHPLLGRRLVDWVIAAARRSAPTPLVVVVSPGVRATRFAGVEVAVQERAARHRRRRPPRRGSARRLRRRRARPLRRRAAAHRRALERPARDPPRRGRPPRPCSRSSRPTRAAYGRVVRDGDGALQGDRRGRRRDRPSSSRSARSTPRSTSSTPSALWPALDRLEPRNAQGELYLTDAVRHLVDAGEPVAVHRRRRPAPRSRA